MKWTKKDLLDIESLDRQEIETLLTCAKHFKKVCLSKKKHVPFLLGSTVINFFVEPSTRTRTSFELAAKHLGATVVNLSADTSSQRKGETLKDTVRNLESLQADVIVMRHSASGAPIFVADRIRSSVINGGDGAHAHPTQAFLDAFTMLEHRPSLEGVRVTILGDILYSRVARSNIWLLNKMGAKVTLCGPRTLVPQSFTQMGCRVTYHVEEAIQDTDFVNLLRIQHERQRKSAAGGPVTLTDKKIIRYFMTIPEASQLVLQSGAMAKTNELFVLDMGKPVKILEMAENMIRLAGFEPYKDIDIQEIGLRPGEKLYEELLIKTEELDKTENSLIFIERDEPLSTSELAEKLDILKEAIKKDDETVREALHIVVPTYKSPEEVNSNTEKSKEMLQ